MLYGLLLGIIFCLIVLIIFLLVILGKTIDGRMPLSAYHTFGSSDKDDDPDLRVLRTEAHNVLALLESAEGTKQNIRALLRTVSKRKVL